MSTRERIRENWAGLLIFVVAMAFYGFGITQVWALRKNVASQTVFQEMLLLTGQPKTTGTVSLSYSHSTSSLTPMGNATHIGNGVWGYTIPDGSITNADRLVINWHPDSTLAIEMSRTYDTTEPQTGDAYPIVSHATYGNAALHNDNTVQPANVWAYGSGRTITNGTVDLSTVTGHLNGTLGAGNHAAQSGDAYGYLGTHLSGSVNVTQSGDAYGYLGSHLSGTIAAGTHNPPLSATETHNTATLALSDMHVAGTADLAGAGAHLDSSIAALIAGVNVTHINGSTAESAMATAADIDTQLSSTHGNGSWGGGGSVDLSPVLAHLNGTLGAGTHVAQTGDGYAYMGTHVSGTLNAGAHYPASGDAYAYLGNHLNGSVTGAVTAAPTVGQIDTQLSSTHGNGSWGGSGSVDLSPVLAHLNGTLAAGSHVAQTGDSFAYLGTHLNGTINPGAHLNGTALTAAIWAASHSNGSTAEENLVAASVGGTVELSGDDVDAIAEAVATAVGAGVATSVEALLSQKHGPGPWAK